MSTTYQAPQLSSYDNHIIPAYASRTQAGRANAAMLGEAVRHTQQQYTRYPAVQQPFTSSGTSSSQSQLRNNPSSGSTHTASRHSTRPSTPGSGGASSQIGDNASRRGSQAVVYGTLQIPASITPKGGSISDFAAQMTCFFWFESIDALRAAEAIRSRLPAAPIPRLTQYAHPFPQFKKWVSTIISTTQVTENVILLALLFVYRLKTLNPMVKGRSGSEYRLLTVALMLGNKFLDDNTYTNKTWAEVSGINVAEIHVMEVEFLSNMRYSLLATKEEWDQWLVKLSCFYEYYERSQQLPESPVAIPSPTIKPFNSPLPSPSVAFQGNQTLYPTTPTTQTAFSPNTILANGQAWPTTYQAAPTLSSPLAGIPNGILSGGRKRSQEDDPTEPPAKRPARQLTNMVTVSMPTAPVSRPPVGETMRLPVPNLTLNTTALPPSYNATTGFASQAGVSLPPLVPGVRAMATVYPGVSSALPQTLPAVTTPSNLAGPSQLSAAPYAPPTVPSHTPIYGTPTKRHSPGNLSGYVSSPMAEGFPGTGIHTPISHSPSVYLQQRPSPYKPVRHVNTLLCPPPSASLHEYHLQVPQTQMHYQPLGRRNDLRTGVVPEFMGMPLRAVQQQHGTPGMHGPGQYPA